MAEAGSLTESAHDVVFRFFEFGRCEQLDGRPVLDQMAEVHEGCEVADSRCLLHVVSDDQDRVFAAKVVDQVFDFSGGDRVQSRARFIKQQDFRIAGDSSGDAQ